jgi:hypothetical protein
MEEIQISVSHDHPVRIEQLLSDLIGRTGHDHGPCCISCWIKQVNKGIRFLSHAKYEGESGECKHYCRIRRLTRAVSDA